MKFRKIIEKEQIGFGQRLKKIREKDVRSLSEICKEIGMTRANWYHIENEQHTFIPIETLRKIETVLNVNFEIDL
jgi:transcriptional regulator with XRE-family HTH domain